MGFDSFLGNSKAVEIVRGFLRSGRDPAALLFTGPDGVGKKTLALMFAKALNCERRPGSDDFCGDCRSCVKAEEMLSTTLEDLAKRREIKDATRRVEGLVYFDLQLIEPITRYILIEQIRQLRSVAYTRPFELRRRIFVIDQAQTVHWQAIDLLLKILEEPPETTSLILICSNPFELRPTIRSRCLPVQFRPLDDAMVRELIAKEGLVPKVRQELGVRIAGGSVAAAKGFDVADYERRRQPWLGFLSSLTRKSGAPDWRALFDSVKAIVEDRDEFERSLRMGYLLLRDLELVLEAGDTARLANIDIVPQLRAWAPEIGFAGLVRLKEGLDQAFRQQIRNVNQQIGLESLAADLLATRSPARHESH